MMARFLHTADWQLGKPFAGIADMPKRTALQRERIAVLERIGTAAQEHGAEFILVAGDVFDSPAATKATVVAACAAIGKMGCPVFIIPGNHDHGGPGSVWEQQFFVNERRELAPNLQVLLEPKPVELDAAVILPCPLLRRHESVDTTAWLRALEVRGEKPRIVLAHGSVQGFSAADDDEEGGGSANRIDLARLEDTGFDYIALGDWHGTKQVGPKAWYAGTPELDRFPRGEDNEPGHVLAVTAKRGSVPEVLRVSTARTGWHSVNFNFNEANALDQLDSLMSSLVGNRVEQDLVRLELSGMTSLDTAAALERRIESWQARLIRLKLSNLTSIEASAEEFAALTQRVEDPLISRVAQRLIERQGGNDDEAAVARIALRELHALLAS